MRSKAVQDNEKKVSLLMAEEEHESYHLEGSEESWAISYADMLMVLLSFFVVFFSMEPNETKDVISQIAIDIGSPANAPKGITDEPINESVTKSNAKAVVQNLQSLGMNLNIKTNVESKTLEIFFPQNIFQPSSFYLDKDNREILRKILRSLFPIEQKIQLFFIGHTDEVAVTKANRYLRSNYSLSALRATHALETAVTMGFPANRVFAQGGADNQINSRTLSVKIKLDEISTEDEQGGPS